MQTLGNLEVANNRMAGMRMVWMAPAPSAFVRHTAVVISRS
jgi:hypothetical protein